MQIKKEGIRTTQFPQKNATPSCQQAEKKNYYRLQWP